MKQNKTLPLAVMLLFLIVLSACSASPQDIEHTYAPSATVENIFTTPTAPISQMQTDSIETTVPVQPPINHESPHNNRGSINFGPKGDPLLDEVGPYRLYEGGELNLPYIINATGSIGDQGVGILLFLDGRPQPYKTAENDTYQYLHTFYPKSGEECIADVIFTPVAGQAGDTLELYATTILNPDYSLSEGDGGFVYTFGSAVSFTRLKIEDTPFFTAEELPKQQKLSLTTTYVDTQFSEISGWSEMELMERVEAHLYVNGVDEQRDRIVYGVTPGKPVNIRYEVWGSPYVHYGIVVFLDNEPVFTAEEEIISVNVQNGKKTVIEAELDMIGFDGESVVYVILVPRNYRTSEIQTQAFLSSSRTFFLVSEEKP